MINIFKRKRKPKFYKAVLQPVKNVMKYCYPDKAVRKHMTLEERLPDNGDCPECKENVWWLLPNSSVAVRTGGKPYVECMNCGYQTHL